MMHMSKMFQMYATKDFANGREIWLAGICRYLNDAYTSLATKVHFILSTPHVHTSLLYSYLYGIYMCGLIYMCIVQHILHN